jgi:hypothetical protein
MERLVFHFNKGKTEREIMYVALSRAKSLDGLYLIGQFKPPAPADSNSATLREMQRLRSDCQLVTKFSVLRESHDALQIISLNAQSIRAHHESIKADSVFKASDFIMLQETWATENENFDIEHKTEVVRNLLRGVPRAFGTMIYARNEFTSSINDQQQSFFGNNERHIEITKCRYNNIEMINIYRSHNSSIDQWKEVLNSIQIELNSDNVIIMGDFNKQLSESSEIFNLLMRGFNLNLLSSPTLSTTNANTTIDGIFGKLKDYHYETYIYETYFSFHKAIVIKLLEK